MGRFGHDSHLHVGHLHIDARWALSHDGPCLMLYRILCTSVPTQRPQRKCLQLAPVTRLAISTSVRAVVSRVTEAAVLVDDQVVGALDRPGLLVLLGVTHD